MPFVIKLETPKERLTSCSFLILYSISHQ